jgi:hypothetical protein
MWLEDILGEIAEKMANRIGITFRGSRHLRQPEDRVRSRVAGYMLIGVGALLIIIPLVFH